MSDFSNIMKVVLKQNGLSIRQYAALLGVSYQSIYQKINRGTVTTRDLDQMQQALNINLAVRVIGADGSEYMLPIGNIKK